MRADVKGQTVEGSNSGNCLSSTLLRGIYCSACALQLYFHVHTSRALHSSKVALVFGTLDPSIS
jgi:hypothetical protein